MYPCGVILRINGFIIPKNKKVFNVFPYFAVMFSKTPY